MACISDEPKTEAATTISAVHPDIIHANILTRLDGAALASAVSSCSQFRTLSFHEDLWSNACHSTWPSTSSPRVRQVISTFSGGSRSFFADSFPTFSTTTATDAAAPDQTPELISAVDIFHRDRLILSKVVETETVTGWFRGSPFRVDMLDSKDVVRTVCKDDTCRDLRVSWIVNDPARKRAVNVSSGEAVCVEEHWLSGEVRSRFATVVTRKRGMAVALCSVVVVTWWRPGGGEEVREVSLQVEDMDGKLLNGRDSLVILMRVLEGERRRGKKEGFCSWSYREFVNMKKEREEEKVRAERRLDMLLCLCVGLIALTFTALFVLWRWKNLL
ncbi:probable F-box protein At2g36090 [Lotus japonicus]|uniref:probable F-box protein At2g36090 n=1 Tax=Lotus japonicus TaxID=34305 RepID=UPI0025866422|nr:probable F-box protein At2g36090 [Lotus japonicus]